MQLQPTVEMLMPSECQAPRQTSSSLSCMNTMAHLSGGALFPLVHGWDSQQKRREKELTIGFDWSDLKVFVQSIDHSLNSGFGFSRDRPPPPPPPTFQTHTHRHIHRQQHQHQHQHQQTDTRTATPTHTWTETHTQTHTRTATPTRTHRHTDTDTGNTNTNTHTHTTHARASTRRDKCRQQRTTVIVRERGPVCVSVHVCVRGKSKVKKKLC